MSIKLEVELAALRARCDITERLLGNLFNKVDGVEALVAEYYAANLALTEAIKALPSQPVIKLNKPTNKPASA